MRDTFLLTGVLIIDKEETDRRLLEDKHRALTCMLVSGKSSEHHQRDF